MVAPFDISYELEHQIAGSVKEGLLSDVRDMIDKCAFSYTRQAEVKGLGHAILTGETLIGNEPFGVILADDFCDNGDSGVIKQMVGLFSHYQCSIVAIEEVPADQTDKYGIVDGKEIDEGLIKVSNMIEKPAPEDAPTNLAVIGRYILTPDIFSVIRTLGPGAAGEIQITDAICEQAKNSMVLAYKFNGTRFDCGSLKGYVEATNYVYDKYHLKV